VATPTGFCKSNATLVTTFAMETADEFEAYYFLTVSGIGVPYSAPAIDSLAVDEWATESLRL
jgi:hypothetical protein